jgi:D-3-phosphoglycerate dehydrogenase / 2-oxoglutarate reductase
MPFHILTGTALSHAGTDLLRSQADVTHHPVADLTSADAQLLQRADALIVGDGCAVDAALLARMPNLRVLARTGTGVSGVDVEAATRLGVLIMHAPGLNTIAVAEFTLGLMLAMARHIVRASQGDDPPEAAGWLGTQLRGRTLGIVGYGRTGQAVARAAHGLGMKVIAYDPYADDQGDAGPVVPQVDLDDLLAAADFVSLHVPEGDETRHLLNAANLALLPAHAMLVNVSAADAVDEGAVLGALEEGLIAGYACDRASAGLQARLRALGHGIATPAIASMTREAQGDMAITVVQQVVDALRGTDLRNVINLPLPAGRPYPQLRPYIHLGECIGMVMQALCHTDVIRVAVEVRGEEMDGLIKPVTVGLLHGMLKREFGNRISAVNAPILANEKGWQLTQTKGLRVGNYANVVSCQVLLADGEAITITGALLDHEEPHIVQINQYRINFVPRDHLLLIGSHDRPGVIGQVGTLLASASVNIASWQTGRAERGGHTLTVLAVDEPVPETTMQALRAFDFIRHARQMTV